jgi:vancomycin resistance protein YoaR
MEFIAPEILDNNAFFQDTLGEYQTRGTGNDDRNRNLTLACNVLNGTVLNPGESLSFQSLLNRVSDFRNAPEDTGLEDVFQGGVSQVSSTLYYAALMSDLHISSRNNHYYVPSFIDYGLDATTSLQITNSTGYPIRIDAAYSGGYVKVAIFGTEERNYYLMLESSISSSTAPQTVYETYSYDNQEGYEDGDVIEEGRNGYLVKSYKVKYDRKTAKELSRDFLTNSQYPAMDQIVARVEEPVVTEPPTEPPTEAPTLPPTEATAPPPETTEATQPPTEAALAETQPEAVSDQITE